MRKPNRVKTELEMAPMPPGPFRRAFMRCVGALHPLRVARRLLSLMRSPAGLILVIVWIALTVITIHLLGAALMGPMRDARLVMLTALGICVGLPFFLVPRLNLEPIGWGIAVDGFVLLALVLLARPTRFAIEQHGYWLADRLAERDAPSVLRRGAAELARFDAWLVHRIPVEVIESRLGTSSEDEATYEALYARLRAFIDEQRARSRRGDPPSIPEVTGIADVLVVDDAEAYKHAASLSADAVARQERRLFQLLNLERSRHGLPQLVMRADLSAVARERARSMRDRRRAEPDPAQALTLLQQVNRATIPARDVKELIGTAKEAGDVARPLLTSILDRPDYRAWLITSAVTYLGVGLAIECDGPLCYGDVLLIE